MVDDLETVESVMFEGRGLSYDDWLKQQCSISGRSERSFVVESGAYSLEEREMLETDFWVTSVFAPHLQEDPGGDRSRLIESPRNWEAYATNAPTCPNPK